MLWAGFGVVKCFPGGRVLWVVVGGGWGMGFLGILGGMRPMGLVGRVGVGGVGVGFGI